MINIVKFLHCPSCFIVISGYSIDDCNVKYETLKVTLPTKHVHILHNMHQSPVMLTTSRYYCKIVQSWSKINRLPWYSISMDINLL